MSFIRVAAAAAAATRAYDLWSNGPVTLGQMVAGSSTTVMQQDGMFSSLTTTTDASSTTAQGNAGRYFEQTSSATDAVAGGMFTTNSSGEHDSNSLPWYSAGFFVDRVTDMSFGFGIVGTNGLTVIDTDTNPALRHLVIGAHTSRSDTNIMVLSDAASGGGSQTRVDTSVPLSQLLDPGIRCLIRMLSDTSARVTIWDITDDSELYDATIDTDVGFGNIRASLAVGVCPRNSGGAVKIRHYYEATGHQFGVAA